jgi:hypothetical protein
LRDLLLIKLLIRRDFEGSAGSVSASTTAYAVGLPSDTSAASRLARMAEVLTQPSRVSNTMSSALRDVHAPAITAASITSPSTTLLDRQIRSEI